MKPLVVFVDKINKDKIIFTETQLKKILEDAYQTGYDDGYNRGYDRGKNGNYWYPYVTTLNNTNSNKEITFDPVTTTPTKTYPDFNYITCEANNSIGDSK